MAKNENKSPRIAHKNLFSLRSFASLNNQMLIKILIIGRNI